MYQQPSPYAPPMGLYGTPQPAPGGYPPVVSGPVNPGDISYGQFTMHDGRTAFQVFMAMPSSFPGANGPIAGIQWTPRDISHSPPQGATPVSQEFLAQYLKNNPNVGYLPGAKESEKESKKSKRHSRQPSSYEQQMQEAQERSRSAQGGGGAYGQPASGPVPFPGTAAHTGYPQQAGGGGGAYGNPPYGAPSASPYGDPNAQQPYGAYSAGAPPYGYGPQADLAQHLSSMSLGASSKEKEKDRPRKDDGKRSRRPSMHEPAAQAKPDPWAVPQYPSANPAAGMYGNPSSGYGVPYPAAPQMGTAASRASGRASKSPNSHTRDVSGASAGPPPPQAWGPPGAYGASPYGVAAPAPGGGGGGAGGARSRANSTVGQKAKTPAPPQPDPWARPKSRAASPNPYPAYPGGGGGGSTLEQRPPSRMVGPPMPSASPNPATDNLGSGSMQAPEAFKRPIEARLAYAAFPPIKIVKNMDDLGLEIPTLPPQPVTTHDVRPDDWHRFMLDLSRAWTGVFPVPVRQDGSPTPPSVLATQVLDTWNEKFFGYRGLEVVLYKGYTRHSGSAFGRRDLDTYPESDGTDYSSSSTEDSEDEDDYPDLGPAPGGSHTYPQAEIAAARKLYFKERKEDKKRRKERRARNKKRRQEKKWLLVVNCVKGGPPSPAAPQAAPVPSHTPAPPPVMPGGMGMPAGMQQQQQQQMGAMGPGMHGQQQQSYYPGMSMYPGMQGPGMGPPPGHARSHSRAASSNGMRYQ